MKVNEAMTRNVVLVSPEDSICEAARMMAQCDAGALPVGKDDRLVGMITDRDIAVRAVAQEMSSATPVADVMTRQVLYCFEDEDLGDVAEKMSTQQVRRLPVLSRDKRLVGILSIGDLSRKVGLATTGKAVAGISTPGGMHNQSHSLH